MQGRFSRRQLLLIAASITGIGALITFADKVLHVFRTPPMPTIVPRAQWGALLPDHQAADEFGLTDDPLNPAWYVYTQPLADVYNTVAIHHSAALLASNETMLSVQKLHMDVNHWADVGYHFGIDNQGIIYAGRDLHVRGASVAKHNYGVIGVVVLGNFEQDTPLPVQLESLQALVNWLASAYTLTHLAGHDEFNPETICPGKNLSAHLDELAQNAGLQRGTSGYVAPV
ncbi:MAG TPA: N-acetylmuramoyl-L-alanine amidase [Phototrophicaceae bacterium]|nr:N-acetylmuramoyl-L-alanine amidase [Phototrophicaceae bacterium]